MEKSNDPTVFDAQDLQRAYNLLPSDNKGAIFENIIEVILSQMVKEGTILSFQRTQKYSKDDCNGVDFWIEVEDLSVWSKPFLAPLSVTSTFFRADQTIRQHPDIPVVYVKLCKEDYYNTLGEDCTKKASWLKWEINRAIEMYTRKVVRKYKVNRKRRRKFIS